MEAVSDKDDDDDEESAVTLDEEDFENVQEA